MSDKRTSITVAMPHKKRMELNALAARTGIPVAAIVRNLVYQKLDESAAK